MNKADEFIVKRSRWVNGSNSISKGGSELLNPYGNMCCVGFLAKACGFSDTDIQNCKTLMDIKTNDYSVEKLHTKIIRADIYITNDHLEVTQTDIELRLIDRFASIGITIKFED